MGLLLSSSKQLCSPTLASVSLDGTEILQGGTEMLQGTDLLLRQDLGGAVDFRGRPRCFEIWLRPMDLMIMLHLSTNAVYVCCCVVALSG